MQPPRRLLLIAAALLVLLSATYGFAFAITNGQPDGAAHPYVGAIRFSDAQGKLLPFCTGVKIAPNLLLTAGHCTYGAALAQAVFGSDLSGNPSAEPPIVVYGKPHTFYKPATGQGLGNSAAYDLGVIEIPGDPSFPPPSQAFLDLPSAQLPQQGLIKDLSAMAAVDVVGYGGQERVRTDGTTPAHTDWTWSANGLRYLALAMLIDSSDVVSEQFVRITSNPARGKGGACFGDSGGPVLQGGTNTVLAVVSFAINANCAGVTYASRVDTPEALDFINSFLPAPGAQQ